MTQQYAPQGFRILPPAVKHLIIINALFFLTTLVLRYSMGIDLNQYLALFFVGSDFFRPWQFVTHMFMHENFMHLFLNMFALWMFGNILENLWGTKRFLFYFFVCGIGAGLISTLATWITSSFVLADINAFAAAPSPEELAHICNRHFRGFYDPELLSNAVTEWRNNPEMTDLGFRYTEELMKMYQRFTIGIPSLGASGATYGILLAFAMMFPNERIYLYFLVPMKVKWFVIGFIVIEFISGITGFNQLVGHFAHLGGMLFGLILMLMWRRRDRSSRWQ